MIPRIALRTGVLLAGLALAGCGSTSPEPPSSLGSTFRAVDVFSEASLEVRAPDVTGREQTALIEESFEDPKLPGWRIVSLGGGRDGSSQARVGTTYAADGRSSVEIGHADGARSNPPHLHRTVPVQPKTRYRLRGALRSEGLEPPGRESVGASIEILEWSEPGRGRPVAYHGHLPRERGSSTDWRLLDYGFRTAPETRFVTVALVTAHGPVSGRAFFDAVSLFEISETAAVVGGEPYTSAQREQVDPRVRLATVGGDTRPTILMEPGSTWTWDIALPERALLRLGLAAAVDGTGPAELCFRISLDARELVDRCLSAGGVADQTWQELSLELGGVGPSATLRFESRPGHGAAPGSGLALWGNPRVDPRPMPAPERQPNVVLLIFDTLRADHLGAEGYRRRPTSPRIDALAGDSVRYARAYAPSAWTTTTLGSLITSHYPSQHGAGLRIPREIEVSDTVSPPGRRSLSHTGLAPGQVTLAQRLAVAGYETVGIHRNVLFGSRLGFARGFDRYAFYSGDNLSGGDEGAELAVEWLERRRQEQLETPYLLVLHLMDPHLPYRMRQEYYEDFGPPRLPPGRSFDSGLPFISFSRWPGRAPEGDQLPRIVAMYDSEIAFADRAAGRLLDALDLDRTIVVALSDHGEGFGEHEHYEHGNSMYDELLRVPLYVRLPDGRHAGTTVDEPVSLIDVLPSLLALLGDETAEGLEGRPLPGLGLGNGADRARPGLFAEGTFLGPDQTALIRDGYKYVLTHPQGWFGFQDGSPGSRRSGDRRAARGELYRLTDDPGELHDLADEQPSLTAELRSEVHSFIEQTSAGLHLRCSGPTDLTLTSSSTIGEIKPMTLEGGDALRVAASRRELTLTPDSVNTADEDWWFVRFLDPAPEVTLARPGCSIELLAGDRSTTTVGELHISGDTPAGIAPPKSRTDDDCWCQVWTILHPNRSATAQSSGLDQETFDRLQALGYVK